MPAFPLLWCYENRVWLRWLAVGVAIAALLGLWRWERHGRLAAERSEQAALQAADGARADAARWQAASDQRDRALVQQAAAIAHLRIAADRAVAVAQRTAQQNRTDAAAADRRIRELEEEAHARPQYVRALGPIVLRRAAGLFD